MNLEEKLYRLGLTKTESMVYIYLLQQGVSSPSQIAKGTGVARTNCYHVLRDLKEKQLIREEKKGKRKVYLATDPESLVLSLEKKRIEMESVIPDLRALYKTTKNKPSITFYEGFSQVKDIYLRTTQADEVYAIGSTKQIEKLDKTFLQKYFSLLKKNNVMFKDILTSQSKEQASTHKEIMKGLYDVHFFSNRTNDQPTDILIWEDNIALITLEDPIFGTVINNSLLTKTFRIIFMQLFDSIDE